MTVTRYKKQPATADAIRDAVLGVTRHKRAVPAQPAEPAKEAKEAESRAEAPARAVSDLVEHHAEVLQAPPARMKINASVKARANRKTRQRLSEAQDAMFKAAFKPYAPPPGVLPKGAEPVLALDSAVEGWAQNSFTSSWNFANPLGEMFAEGVGFLGYAYLSQLTQRPEYRRISERIATEMTRKWIRLTISGEADPESTKDKTEDADEADENLGADKAPDRPLSEEEDDDADGAAAGGAVADSDADEKDDEPTPEEKAQRARNEKLQKKLLKIEEEMKRLDLRGKFKQVAEFDGWMGRAHLYIDTGDSKDLDLLKTDLGNGSDETSKSNFKKGSLRNVKLIEPIWCYPVNYNANDPLADDWYNPQLWFAMAKQLHASRLLTFVGRPLPDILKPSYAFGGLSMSQMAKPYVDNWLRTRQAVTALIESFSVSGVYTNAQSLLQGGGDEVLDRIELFNAGRDNAGTMVLDKDTEEFFNISTPLGTLDHLQAQSQEQMSSVSGIPLIVLLGITPSGLNASSEGELRVFYDLIHAMQESLFRDKLHRLNCFIQLNIFGEVDPAIGFDFEPLWSLDEKGEAEVRKIHAETHQIYVDMGVVGQEEIRKIEIDDDDSPYQGLDPDELPEPPAETGMMPAGGGAGGGESGSSRADNKEVDGAADRAITEVAADVFAFDDGQFDESKHKRDQAGKFSSTGAGGGAENQETTEEKPSFKTKKEHIAHLLKKGVTPKELMQEMGWPSVSMPAQAKSLGMKLEKKEGKYFGTLMTDAEKAAAKEEATGKKTDASAQQILKNAGIALSKPAPKVAEKPKFEPASDYEDFKQKLKDHVNAGNKTEFHELMDFHPGFAEQMSKETAAKAKKPMIPPATAEEMKKAKKATTVPMSSTEPDAVAAIKDFNAKYAGKEGLSAEQLSEKVHDYKTMLKKVKETESAAAEAAAKKVEENAAKASKEKAAKAEKEKAEMQAKFDADPELKVHYEAMEAMFGGKDAGAQYLKNAESKVKSAGLSKVMSGADAVPIIAYSGSHYGPLNAELRRGTMTVAQYKFMKSLNAGLDKLPAYEKTTYRKANLSAEQFKAYVPGHIVEERGFTSTSKTQGTWSGNYDYTVHGKTGRDIQKLSSHHSEAEVLFKSGTRFMVKSVSGNHITLEEV